MAVGHQGVLLVVSGPSGVGKGAVIRELLRRQPGVSRSVSCTTREPRGSEEDGIDYHFLSRAAYDRLVAEKAFLEHAEVHGNGYGTLEAPIREAVAEGLSVVMDIDVQGAEQVRNQIEGLPENDPLRVGFVDIFILPPSVEALRERLLARGEDSPAAIERRLRNAVDELAQADQYRFRVVNNDLDVAYRDLCGILEAVGGVKGHDDPTRGPAGNGGRP